jgi:serine/threonine-protein kinase HipA
MTLDPSQVQPPDVPVAPTVPYRLDVWLGGRRVAQLEPAGAGSASLTYLPAAHLSEDVASSGQAMLSVRLPFRDKPYPAVEVRPFLAGLLPEGRVQEELARRAGVVPDDLVGMLDAYGADCAGAVSVVPEGAVPADVASEVRWLTNGALAEAVRQLPRAPLGVGIDPRVRVSLAGVQGKLLVVRRGDALGVPLDGAPSTHILKPPAADESGERWPGIAWLERWGLALLGAAGIPAATAEVLALESGYDALLVERFDRHIGEDGGVVRRHQEDFCQALGVMPVEKYEGPGRRVSWRGIAELLRRTASEPLVAQLSLLDRMVASIVVGDADLHAKNLSLFLDDGRVSLAPAYDVVPTVVFGDVSDSLALHVSGEVSLTAVRRESLEAEAASWGIGPRLVRRRIVDVLQRLDAAIEVALAALGPVSAGAEPGLVAAVGHARATLARLAR